MICPLKARTVEPEEMAVATEQLGKQVSVTIDTHLTTEEPLEAVFSMHFVLGLYTQD